MAAEGDLYVQPLGGVCAVRVRPIQPVINLVHKKSYIIKTYKLDRSKLCDLSRWHNF